MKFGIIKMIVDNYFIFQLSGKSIIKVVIRIYVVGFLSISVKCISYQKKSERPDNTVLSNFFSWDPHVIQHSEMLALDWWMGLWQIKLGSTALHLFPHQRPE